MQTTSAIYTVLGSIVLFIVTQLGRLWLRAHQFKLLRTVLPVDVKLFHLISYFFLPGHAYKPSRLAIRSSITKKVEGDVLNDLPTRRAYLHSAEVEQICKLIRAIAPFPIEARLITAEGPDPDDQHIVIVDGSYHNATAIGLMKRLNRVGIHLVPGQLGRDHAHYTYNDRRFGCSMTYFDDLEGRKIPIITHDSGLIYRCRTDNGAEVLLCVGIHMHGSAAALATALSSDFQKEVEKRGLLDFVQFVEVNVLADGISVDWSSISWDPALLIDARL